VAFFSGDAHGADQLTEAAIARLVCEPPSGPFAMLLGAAAFLRSMRMELGSSSELVRRAIEMGEVVGEQQAVAFAINVRGLVGVETGHPDALGDLEASLAMFEEVGSTLVTMAKFHLGFGRLVTTGPAYAASALEDAIAHGTRTHNAVYAMWARVEEISRLADAGAWDELLQAVDNVLTWADANGSLQHSASVAPHKARVLALRGNTTAARMAMGGALEHAQGIGYPQAVVPALTSAALIERLDGNSARARELCRLVDLDRLGCASPVAEVCRVLVSCDARNDARLLLDHIRDGPAKLLNNVTSARAVLAEADSDHSAADTLYQDAANRWRAYDSPYEIAHALAGRSRCLATLGRIDAAETCAKEAEAIFARLGVCDPLVPTHQSA
jgi:hypothetical protein